jgi:hypothetical protein
MQRRRAWCRACGGEGSYATGWCVMLPDQLSALQDAVRAPIQTQKGLGDGRPLVRLRVRHLKCVHCGERGLLVAGARPIPLDRSSAAVPR